MPFWQFMVILFLALLSQFVPHILSGILLIICWFWVMIANHEDSPEDKTDSLLRKITFFTSIGGVLISCIQFSNHFDIQIAGKLLLVLYIMIVWLISKKLLKK